MRNRIKHSSHSFMATCASLVLLIVLSSCDNGDDGITPQDTEANLIQGTWKVTYFFDDADETHHFSGYVFSFSEDGSALAVNGSATVNGTWVIQVSSNDQVKLILDFGVDDPFEELSEDWRVIENASSRIKLEHVSGGSGETDYLTLERN